MPSKVNQSSIINEIKLNNLNIDEIEKKNIDTQILGNCNIISKNLKNNNLDYIYIDDTDYSYREFSFDENIEESIECVKTEKLNFKENKSFNYIKGNNIDNETYNVAIGKVVSCFNIYNKSINSYVKQYYMSTGFLVGKDIVLSTAHSIFMDVTINEYNDNIYNPTFADEVYFILDNEDDINVNRIYIDVSYYNETKNDWSILKIDEEIGSKYGYFNLASNFNFYDSTICISGYSIEDTSNLTKLYGNIKFINGNEYMSQIKTKEGQSGSPYIIQLDHKYYVIGIHSGLSIINDSIYYSRGLIIDDKLLNFIASFNSNEIFFDIKPTDYDYEDAYPIDYSTMNFFKTHNLENGLTFRTRRYRTGYIHNEFIVMSPIRYELNDRRAFIEYNFSRPLTKINVELSMWRDVSKEYLSSKNGNVMLQIPDAYDWKNYFDLLSSEVNLPTNRNNTKIYTIKFNEPIYNFRFYSEYFGTSFASNANRGRICIGNMRIYLINDDYMSLSFYELEWEPYLWTGDIEKNINCYGYILNNQTNPITNELYKFQQPGEYANKKIEIDNLTEEQIISYVKSDFKMYSLFKNKEFIFSEIGRNQKCAKGNYKVCLRIRKDYNPYPDYHWYRQDQDGYWSHKIGDSPVSRLDSNGRLIKDPSLASTNNYDTFVGYFELTPWRDSYVF